MENEEISKYIPLVRSISKKFYNVEEEDLIQAGIVGLINAYKHYDKGLKTKFLSFAYPYIFGEMYNLSIKSKSLKINKDTLKLVKLIEKAKAYLTQSLGKEPTINDISSYLKINEEIISDAIMSIQVIISLDYDDNEGIYNSIKMVSNKDELIDLKTNLQRLSKEERNIILYRYFKDMTQSETAKILNISQVKVSRYEQKSLKKLKKVMVYE